MTSYRISVTADGKRQRVESSEKIFDFFGLVVNGYTITEDGGQLALQGPVKHAPAVAPSDSVVLSQLTPVQDLVADIQNDITSIEEMLVVNNLLIAERAGETDELRCRMEYIEGNVPIEETLISGLGGETVFSFTQLAFDADDAVPDIQVWIETDKQIQDQAGGTTFAFRKLNTTDIEFSETVPEGFQVTGRLELDRITNPKPANPFFRHYVDAVTGQDITVPEEYDLMTGKLGYFRNGLYMAESAIVGPFSARYAEYSRDQVRLAHLTPSVPVEVHTFYHLDTATGGPPIYKIFVKGLVGSTLTVPTFTVGTDQLMVFRNGLIMNTQTKGPTSFHYTENSSTELGLTVASTADEYWIFQYSPVAPQWRDDLDGIVGVDVDFTLGNNYTPGDKKLLVWKNASLIYDSSTLATSFHRYSENGVNCILLEEPLTAIEWITAIYL